MEHTPIPWTNHDNNLSGANGRGVALTDVYMDTNDYARSRAENDANAAFIVKAVNNHEKLVKALKDILPFVGMGEEELCAREGEAHRVEAAAVAVLAEAEKE